MIDKEILKLISVNRDAAAVNRGFYFQYLNVLRKWVGNFIDDRETEVFTEVGDDIKEVNGKMVFTQVKCYSSTFNLKSKEVHKALFNFFALYLEERESVPDLEFHFLTNTAIAKNERLLKNWMAAGTSVNDELLAQCTKKVADILHDELKKIRTNRLNAIRLNEAEKQTVRQGFDTLCQQLAEPALMAQFVKCIRWDFGAESPETNIARLTAEILELLDNEKFQGKPHHLLMESLLSEIYRCSQLADPELRKVNNAQLHRMLAAKTEELNGYINKGLIQLINVQFNVLAEAIDEVKQLVEAQGKVQAEHGMLIENITSVISGQAAQKLPKELTAVPFINISSVIGRDGDKNKIYELLSAGHRVSLFASGGMGKSILAKLYINSFRDKYDHIIWLQADTGLLNSFIVNNDLAANLQLYLVKPEKDEVKFAGIVRKLNTVGGNNILIIDGLADGLANLQQLNNLNNWSVLITTRLRVQDWETYQVSNLSYVDSKTLYRRFEPGKVVSEDEFWQFFELIGYNLLSIELIAKTVHFSVDLTLKDVLAHLISQSLDDEELAIDVPVEGNTTSQLLKQLNKAFDLTKLEKDDQFYMEFFALLPSEEISLNDLVDWYGKDYKKANKVQMANAINNLHQKGLLERNGDQLKMHKVFQESIIYQVRQSVSPFIGQMFHIAWLRARLHEGVQYDPAQGLRFLKYGESILAGIKEPFRLSVYQPLLALENEVLNIQNWLKTADQLVDRWASLAQRAEAYLHADDTMVGVIFNNYGLALAGLDRLDEAELFFNKSLAIYRIHEAEMITQLIIGLGNMAQLHVRQGDIKGFQPYFDEMVAIRDKYKLWTDFTFPMQCHVLGDANQNIGNFPMAIQMYVIGINAHYELPADKRNDLNLVLYLNDLAISYLANKEPDKAEKTIVRAVNVLDRLQARDSQHLITTIRTLLLITEYTGDAESAAKLRSTLEGMTPEE